MGEQFSCQCWEEVFLIPISLLLPKEDKGAFPLPECFAEQYGSVVPGERGGIRIQGFEDSVPLEAE